MPHQNHIVPQIKSHPYSVLRSKTDRFWIDPQIRKHQQQIRQHQQLHRMPTLELMHSARLEISRVEIPESPLPSRRAQETFGISSYFSNALL